MKVHAWEADAIICALGSDFINSNPKNWADKTDISDEKFYENFESNIKWDYAVDYVGSVCYFYENEPVAWVDFENRYGYVT